MSLITTDHSGSNKSFLYASIYEHYGVGEHGRMEENESLIETKSSILERNDNNKKKKINAKTVTKSPKKTKTKHSRSPKAKVYSRYHLNFKSCKFLI